MVGAECMGAMALVVSLNRYNQICIQDYLR